jgi:hypothetical protein
MPVTWFLSRVDTTPPLVSQVQPVNSRLVEIRFSEPIRLDTLAPEQWAVADTLSNKTFEAKAVYQPVNEPNQLMVVTDSLPIGVFSISRAGIVKDSTGNEARDADLIGTRSFGTSMRPDTMKTRFEGFRPQAVEPGGAIAIAAGRSPALVLNRFLETDSLLARISARGPGDDDRGVTVATSTGTTWRLAFEPPARPGDSIAVSFAGLPAADTVYSTVFAFLSGEQTGSITGVIGDTLGVAIDLFSTQSPTEVIRNETDESGQFRFDRLMKGAYRVRLLEDRDGDGRWTPGSLDPPRAPEPMFWYPQTVDVRAGWESSVDTLAFPAP